MKQDAVLPMHSRRPTCESRQGASQRKQLKCEIKRKGILAAADTGGMMKIGDTPMSPLLALQKGIFIAGVEKPKCCFDCRFLTKPETIHQFFEVEGERKQYFKHVYNCTMIPEDEEDGWHDLEWTMENIQPWCPIVEMKLSGISVKNLTEPDRDNYSFSFS